MKDQKAAVQKAIEDITTVRQAIAAAQGGHIASSRSATSAHLTVQIVAIVLALAALIGEIATGNWIARTLSLTVISEGVRVSTITLVGLILVVLVGALYFVVLRASRLARRDFSTFVARNFSYLMNLSFLSDLLVKFAILAIVVQTGAPAWIPPLLFLFIGDYLFQGRFFTLPMRIALIAGVVCVAAGAAQAWLGSSAVLWPLAGFSVVCALSIAFTVRMRRADDAQGSSK